MDCPIDLTAPSAIADPFPALAWLREEAPAHWHAPIKSWCVTRYDDVVACCQDPRFSSERIAPFVARQRAEGDAALRELGECVSLWMVFNDPPSHTRLRKLTRNAFTTRAMEELRPRIETLVHELIDRMQGDRADFVRDFAYPLPANVIADLLGVPRESVDDLKRWSDDLAGFVLSSRIDPDKHAKAAASLEHMNALFRDLIRERRRRPRGDLVDTLIAARDSDERLSEEELLAFCVLLLFAGHETTTHFFSNGLLALARHPHERERFRTRRGDARFVANALDEILRFDGPILSMSRVMTEDVTLHGERLRRGDRVFLFNAAANRDPRRFESPDRLDLERADAGRMVGFGHGIHLCLGVHLARLEGAIGFPALLDRWREFEVEDTALEYQDTLVIRGPKGLGVRFERSPR